MKHDWRAYRAQHRKNYWQGDFYIRQGTPKPRRFVIATRVQNMHGEWLFWHEPQTDQHITSTLECEYDTLCSHPGQEVILTFEYSIPPTQWRVKERRDSPGFTHRRKLYNMENWLCSRS